MAPHLERQWASPPNFDRPLVMKVSLRNRSSLFGVFIALAVAGVAVGLWTHFHGQHAAGHEHGAHGETALSLNDGQRWETDLPLRTGMQRIRDAVAPALRAQSAGRLSASDADRLAATIQENVNYLIANCKLAPKADATLHMIITDLLSGSGMLKEAPASSAGSSLLVQALRRYADYFAHPDWQPVTVPPAT